MQMMLQTAATNKKSWGKSCSSASSCPEDPIYVKKPSVAISSSLFPVLPRLKAKKGEKKRDWA